MGDRFSLEGLPGWKSVITRGFRLDGRDYMDSGLGG